jgi:hypothetical protein
VLEGACCADRRACPARTFCSTISNGQTREHSRRSSTSGAAAETCLRAFVTAARATDVSPEHPLRTLEAGRASWRSSRSRPTSFAPLGIPGLYESTGGNPRFVTETLANGRSAALLADAHRGASRSVPGRGNVGLPRPRRRVRARTAF